MNFSRQALLGIGMVVGGIVMLYAMAQQIGSSDKPTAAPAVTDQTTTEQVIPKPLTTDVETEKRILAQKQKERAARVAAKEQRAQQFSTEQEDAETQALARANSENQQYLNNTTTGGDSDSPEAAQNTIPAPVVQPRPEAAADKTATSDAKKAEKVKTEEKVAANNKKDDNKQLPKTAQDYKIESGDGLLKVARQYNVSVAALAQANNIEPSATLQIGQVLTVPSGKQIERLEREAAAAKKAKEEKLKKEQAQIKKSADAQKNLVAARKEVKETDAKGSFGVQVALATNQSKADAVAKKYRAAGYEVKTVNVGTGRGVRVIVGPERGKIAALALKDKVNSDANVNATDAWVRYWD